MAYFELLYVPVGNVFFIFCFTPLGGIFVTWILPAEPFNNLINCALQ